MSATVDNLVFAVRLLPPGAVWQAIVIGRPHVDLSTVALAMGGNVRTGLEDTLYMRRGELATSNEALVTRLVGIAHTLDRSIASVQDAEAEFRLGA